MAKESEFCSFVTSRMLFLSLIWLDNASHQEVPKDERKESKKSSRISLSLCAQKLFIVKVEVNNAKKSERVLIKALKGLLLWCL